MASCHKKNESFIFRYSSTFITNIQIKYKLKNNGRSEIIGIQFLTCSMFHILTTCSSRVNIFMLRKINYTYKTNCLFILRRESRFKVHSTVKSHAIAIRLDTNLGFLIIFLMKLIKKKLDDYTHFSNHIIAFKKNGHS